MARQLPVFSSGEIPTDSQESFILNLYKGTPLAAATIAVWSSQIKSWSCWNGLLHSHCWRTSIRCSLALCLVEVPLTPSPLFTICRRYIVANNPLYFAVVDLEKARVPSKVLWWALMSLDTCRGMVCVCHSRQFPRSWLGQWSVQGRVWRGSGCVSGLLSFFCSSSCYQ